MLALTLTAELTGYSHPSCHPTPSPTNPHSVTDLHPLDTSEEPYFYTFKVECTSCRETHPNWVSISRFVRFFSSPSYLLKIPKYPPTPLTNPQESTEISGSKGEANFVWRCKACKVIIYLTFLDLDIL